MPQTSETAERAVLVDRCRVPNEVESLPGCIAVVDAVVAEVPCGLDVHARSHADLRDRPVGSARVDQGAVRRVMTQHKQAGDAQPGQKPQHDHSPPEVGQRQASNGQQIQQRCPQQRDGGASRRSPVAGVGNHGPNVVERLGARSNGRDGLGAHSLTILGNRSTST